MILIIVNESQTEEAMNILLESGISAEKVEDHDGRLDVRGDVEEVEEVLDAGQIAYVWSSVADDNDENFDDLDDDYEDEEDED